MFRIEVKPINQQTATLFLIIWFLAYCSLNFIFGERKKSNLSELILQMWQNTGSVNTCRCKSYIFWFSGIKEQQSEIMSLRSIYIVPSLAPIIPIANEASVRLSEKSFGFQVHTERTSVALVWLSLTPFCCHN